MRNEPKPLDREDAMRCYALRDMLTEGDTFTLTYEKRDGTVSTSTGPVMFHNGRDGMDTMSVTLDTPEKGRATTVNLCRVTHVDGDPIV